MKLKRIRIENFRSIESLDFNPCDLCAFVGENNAGKSNVLRALNLILGETWPSERAFSEEDFFNYDTSKDIVIEVWTDTPIQFNRYGISLECHGLRITVGHYKKAVTSKGKVAGDLKFEFIPLNAKGNQISGPTQQIAKGTKPNFSPIRVSSEIREGFPFVYIDVRRDYARHTAGSRWSILSRLFSSVNEDFQRAEDVKDAQGNPMKRRDLFKKRMDDAFELLRTDEFVKVEDLIRKYALKQVGLDPTSSNVKIEFRPFDTINAYKSLSMVLCEGAHEFDAEEIGAGYQSSIVVAIFRAYQELNREGAIIAIEEPEIFLHPHRQRFFFKVLTDLVAQGNQVFYTTHSAHFVDITSPEHVCIVRKTPQNGTKIASCPAQIWTPDKKELFKLEKEFDPERNEMFFAKGVLLCEGDTEKALFPILMKDRGIDLDEIGVSVVECGGKGNLPFFVKVVEHFSIPYVVVQDEDKTSDPINTDIVTSVQDQTRRIVFKPKLEDEMSYAPGKNKVESAISFVRGQMTATNKDRLLEPFIRLFQEIKPEIASNLKQATKA